MQNLWIRAGLIALTLGASYTVHGAAAYDNGAPDQVYGTNMSEVLVAENFTIGATVNFTNIRFWSIQDAITSYTGSVYWAVYSDVASKPGLILGKQTTPPTRLCVIG